MPAHHSLLEQTLVIVTGLKERRMRQCLETGYHAGKELSLHSAMREGESYNA